MVNLLIKKTDTLPVFAPERRKTFGLVRCSPRPWASSKPYIAERPKVLLIEDDAVTGWMVRNILGDCCQLKIVTSGEMGVDHYQEMHPDVVFLDINLPDFSGFEVLKHVKEIDVDAKIVMFTHHDAFENMSRALADGASGFIVKPFQGSDLFDYIWQR
jgi:two-component system, chemotaxis family, chemotaxis protein CheY